MGDLSIHNQEISSRLKLALQENEQYQRKSVDYERRISEMSIESSNYQRRLNEYENNTLKEWQAKLVSVQRENEDLKSKTKQLGFENSKAA